MLKLNPAKLHCFRLLLLLILQVNWSLAADNSSNGKQIRIALEKATTMEAGQAGQPVTSYYANVDIGTPGKPFKLLLDINAKETWVPHYLTLGGIIYHRLHYNRGYAKKASSSSVKEEREFTINSLGCQLTGKPYEDVFKFQNSSGEPNPSKSVSVRQKFLAISSANNNVFAAYPTDGVLSLSPSFISDLGARNLLANLQHDNLIEQLRFSLHLDSNLDSSSGGELLLGAANPNKFLGNFYYHALSNLHDRWELNLQNVMLGGQMVSCHNKGCSAVLATGLNDIYGPAEDVKRIMSLLAVSKRLEHVSTGNRTNATGEAGNKLEIFEVECLRIVDMPTITIHIDGMAYTIPPAMYIKKKVDGLIFKSSTCYVTIFSHQHNNQWVLGTNFLANYYTTFDLNRRQVGFAAKSQKH